MKPTCALLLRQDRHSHINIPIFSRSHLSQYASPYNTDAAVAYTTFGPIQSSRRRPQRDITKEMHKAKPSRVADSNTVGDYRYGRCFEVHVPSCHVVK